MSIDFLQQSYQRGSSAQTSRIQSDSGESVPMLTRFPQDLSVVSTIAIIATHSTFSMCDEVG